MKQLVAKWNLMYCLLQGYLKSLWALPDSKCCQCQCSVPADIDLCNWMGSLEVKLNCCQLGCANLHGQLDCEAS